jgi:hypothetical protein
VADREEQDEYKMRRTTIKEDFGGNASIRIGQKVLKQKRIDQQNQVESENHGKLTRNSSSC